MTYFSAPIFALLALVLTPLTAFGGEVRQSPVAVLELFTSEGCSSCPPADALLGEYGARADVVTLAYHVDYWDYIGWRDTFGDPAYSTYQRAYATAQGKGRIYTPQLMVNGEEDVVGSRRDDVARAVARAALKVPVRLTVRDDMLEVNASGDTGLPESAVWLVAFRSRAEVEVARGENRGATLIHTNVVTNRQILGMWEPVGGATVKLPLADILVDGADGVAILIQEENRHLPGRILGAAAYLP